MLEAFPELLESFFGTEAWACQRSLKGDVDDDADHDDDDDRDDDGGSCLLAIASLDLVGVRQLILRRWLLPA